MSIEDRPKVVDRRSRIGDWEGDLVEGKDRRAYLLTLVDRRTGYLLVSTAFYADLWPRRTVFTLRCVSPTSQDRPHLFVSCSKVGSKKAHIVRDSSIRLLQKMKPAYRKTLTFDNGTEFSNFKQIESKAGMDVYFAHPYSSWERGMNENTNGLLRQYFPKGKDLRVLPPASLAAAAHRLNNRPRKRLGYQTPAEVLRHKK